MSHEDQGVLGDWFFNDHRELFKSIYLPSLSGCVLTYSTPNGVYLNCTHREIDKWCANPAPQPHALLLMSLPTELLDLIIAELSFPHAAALGVTCRAALAAARAHIERKAGKRFAVWAGCRLLCLSVNATWDNDLPAGLLTAEGDTHSDNDDAAGGFGAGAGPAALQAARRTSAFTDFVCNHYRLVFGWVWALARDRPTEDILAAITFAPDEGACPNGDLARLRALTAPELWGEAEERGPRVLANLSRGGFVREDALGIARERRRAQVRVGWGHVLLARICWASDGRTGMQGFTPGVPGTRVSVEDRGDGEGEERGRREYEYILHRGEWAGHRFAIVPLKRMWELDVKKGMIWRDVSEEVDAELRLIWERQGIEDLDPEMPTPEYQPWEVCPDRCV